jgi:hypothetical protein
MTTIWLTARPSDNFPHGKLSDVCPSAQIYCGSEG